MTARRALLPNPDNVLSDAEVYAQELGLAERTELQGRLTTVIPTVSLA
jgi:hypothetical protein